MQPGAQMIGLRNRPFGVAQSKKIAAPRSRITNRVAHGPEFAGLAMTVVLIRLVESGGAV